MVRLFLWIYETISCFILLNEKKSNMQNSKHSMLPVAQERRKQSVLLYMENIARKLNENLMTWVASGENRMEKGNLYCVS